MKLSATSWTLAAGFVPAIVCTAPAQALGEFDFHHDAIIGTSLDLLVSAKSPALAIHCQSAVLGEIERLRRILSIYDPTSEISQVNRGGAVYSPELAELLDIYRRWEARTGGIITARMGRVISQWKFGVPA
ncbi:MAG: FAD:protein FMN transferase [Tepidisphaerales bacterium]